MKKLLSFSLMAAFAASSAFAGDTSATLEVSASVPANCMVSVATAIAFGAYDPISNPNGNLDAEGGIKIACTNQTVATIKLDQGTHYVSGGGKNYRTMAGTGDPLRYELYSDAARSTPWDNTKNAVSYTGTGLEESRPVYARIPGGQKTVQAGSFTDQVVVTVSF